MKAAWILPAMVVAGLGQTTDPVTREGLYWWQTSQGAASVPAAVRSLRVSTRGPISVRGSGEGTIAYKVRKRVKARTQQDAERLLEQFSLKTKTVGEGLQLDVTYPERPAATAELEIQVPRSFARVDLETQAGAVEAFTLDGALDLETGGGLVRVDGIGGDVGVRTGGGEMRLGKIGGSLRCLSGGGTIRADYIGGRAFFETAGGEIYVRQVKGTVEAITAGGNIHVEKAGSSVKANTSGGLIDILYAGGPVTAGTAAGCIKVASAKGVRLESAAGPIQLRGVSGALNVSTVAGNIVTELFAGDPLEDSFLNTGAGDVTVYIPSSLALTVRARNESLGRLKTIVTDFPEIRVTPEGLPSSSPLVAEGQLNGGGPLLRILAAGGTIYLRKQK